MTFEYNCPICDSEIENGGFGDNVYCENCNKTFETEWDYISEDSMSSWLTGIEFDGKIDISE